METLIGATFKDFVMISADMSTSHSVLLMKDDENKLFKISSKLVMAISGEAGDTTQFAEYIAKNVQLYKMRNGYELSPLATASFTRQNMAEYLRTKSPYFVNMLIAGYDAKTGPQLFFLDYLASLVKNPFAAHGFGGYFALTIMDRYHRADMSVAEGYDLIKKCVREIQKRLIINQPNFKVQVIDKNGVRELPPITAKALVMEDTKM